VTRRKIIALLGGAAAQIRADQIAAMCMPTNGPRLTKADGLPYVVAPETGEPANNVPAKLLPLGSSDAAGTRRATRADSPERTCIRTRRERY
jgi:hypothetical protein